MNLCEFQTSQSYIVRFCLKSKNNRNYLSTHKNFSTHTYFHLIEEKIFLYFILSNKHFSPNLHFFFKLDSQDSKRISIRNTKTRKNC